jgi:predicted Zn finger-like uncharacterized protein
MALATQCPFCHTTFRVASDQLKLRGGIVRCGACQSIFDGSAHLIDLDALAAQKQATPAPAPAAEPPSEQQAAAPQDGEAASPPVYTLDFDHTFDPLGILPKAAPAEPSAAPRAQVWRNGGMPAAEVEADADAATNLPEADTTPLVEPAEELDEPDERPAGAAPEFIPEFVPEETPEAVPEDVAEPAPEAAPAPVSEPEAPGAPEPAPGFVREPEPEPELAPAAAYAPQGRIEPSFDLPPDEELVAQPLPGDEHAYQDELPAAPFASAAAAVSDIPPAALPLRASAAGADTLAPPSAPGPAPAPKSARAKAVEARSRRSRLTPTRIEAPKLRVPAGSEADEPEFVKRSRKQEQSGRTRRLLTIAGAVVLVLLLAAQLLVEFRNVLAARYPGARPVLNAGCAVLRCRVGLPNQIENLSIETGELSTLGVDTYSLNTLLRNQGSLVQAWPSIQLELTDANDKPLLRRVFGPAEYLPQGVPAAAGFAARSEQPVRLNFALRGLKPSSYHMIVFYP